MLRLDGLCQVSTRGSTACSVSQQQQYSITHHHSDNFDNEKLTHSIIQCFFKENKLSGKVGKNINECLAIYDETNSDNGFIECQNFK